ncbi:MAG: N-acetylneuraminate synthase family protein [Planctomycetes bacterium]|nr:N-acetylneuraminate synthase family protein [Planctomycetota bacterium]
MTGPLLPADGRVLVVAEIGNNHEGDFDLAGELVRLAARSGADAVKFQTFRTEHYVSRADETRFRRLKGFELPPSRLAELASLARDEGLLFLSTPFDMGSAAILEGVVDAYKIASGDLDFLPLLDRVARSGKPVVLSTGASDLARVERGVEFVHERQRAGSELAVLHCVSSYPVPAEEANLRSIPFLAGRLGVPIGYSDHTIGIDAAVLAVALGARIVEKHFTIAKDHSDFRDHQLSADPAEMKSLVEKVRLAIRMLGESAKAVQPSERGSVDLIRRSIVAAGDLPLGRRIEWADLTWVRPAGGLAPGQESVLLGKRLRRDVGFGDRILPADVE